MENSNNISNRNKIFLKSSSGKNKKGNKKINMKKGREKTIKIEEII